MVCYAIASHHDVSLPDVSLPEPCCHDPARPLSHVTHSAVLAGARVEGRPQQPVVQEGDTYAAAALLSSATTMVLTHRNIARISNLLACANLRVLKLNNNHVRHIEGIDHLLQLECLDLSFNHLQSLEGLAPLPRLSDLLLSHNHLTGGLCHLERTPALRCLTLAHNSLSATEELRHLRRLPALQSVTLAGNPLLALVPPAAVKWVVPQLTFVDFEAAQAAPARSESLQAVLPAATHQALCRLVAAEEARECELAVAAAEAAEVAALKDEFLHLTWRLPAALSEAAETPDILSQSDTFAELQLEYAQHVSDTMHRLRTKVRSALKERAAAAEGFRMQIGELEAQHRARLAARLKAAGRDHRRVQECFRSLAALEAGPSRNCDGDGDAGHAVEDAVQGRRLALLVDCEVALQQLLEGERSAVGAEVELQELLESLLDEHRDAATQQVKALCDKVSVHFKQVEAADRQFQKRTSEVALRDIALMQAVALAEVEDVGDLDACALREAAVRALAAAAEARVAVVAPREDATIAALLESYAADVAAEQTRQHRRHRLGLQGIKHGYLEIRGRLSRLMEELEE